jgi:hypothetical protein
MLFGAQVIAEIERAGKSLRPGTPPPEEFVTDP